MSHNCPRSVLSDITIHYKWFQGSTAIRINGVISRIFPAEAIGFTGLLIQWFMAGNSLVAGEFAVADEVIPRLVAAPIMLTHIRAASVCDATCVKEDLSKVTKLPKLYQSEVDQLTIHLEQLHAAMECCLVGVAAPSTGWFGTTTKEV